MTDADFLRIVTGAEKIFVGVPDSRDSIVFFEVDGLTIALGLKV